MEPEGIVDFQSANSINDIHDLKLIIESNATCADNKDIAIYEHRVSHRIQGSSTFLFRF
jgi:hypothetical protein